MKLLAIDTATEACSVALTTDDEEVIERHHFDPRGHSDQLLPMVADVLAEAGLSPRNLDAVAFDSGPGSFTGIRIGLGVAQGLVLGLNLQLVGISSLMALAEGSAANTVLPAIDARMGQVYWARLARDSSHAEGWIWHEEPQVSDPSAVPTLFDNEVRIGNGWQRYCELEKDGKSIDYGPLDTFPCASCVAMIARRLLVSRTWNSCLVQHPVYIRSSVTR